MTLVIIFTILLALFGLAFATKRRFGVLGLALAAGAVLAQYASSYVGDWLQQYELSLAGMSYDMTASVLLIMTPSLLLLAGGPTYRTHRAAIVGALGFALLGLFFVLGPISTVLPATNDLTHDALIVMARLQTYVIVAALVFALLDTFMIHGAAGRRYHKDEKKR